MRELRVFKNSRSFCNMHSSANSQPNPQDAALKSNLGKIFSEL